MQEFPGKQLLNVDGCWEESRFLLFFFKNILAPVRSTMLWWMDGLDLSVWEQQKIESLGEK